MNIVGGNKLGWIDKVGATFLGVFKYYFTLFALFYLSIKVVWTDRDLGQRDFMSQVLLQIYFTGVQAAGPIISLAIVVGAFSFVSGMGGIGGALSGADNLGRMITVVVLREIAPLLTGGVVIVRSVTAIASELGGMRVQREIEAIEAMGISPIRHLVTPRIFGGVLSLFGLNILFSAIALIGGFLIAQLVGSIPAGLFIKSVFSAVHPIDIVGLSIKIFVGGIGLFVIACYHGMSVGKSSTDVPIAVSRASLNAFVFFVFLNGGVSIISITNSSMGMFGGVF